jgi:peptidyl-prolyl cis-trans isomerase C
MSANTDIKPPLGNLMIIGTTLRRLLGWHSHNNHIHGDSMAKGNAGKVRASHILVEKQSQAQALIGRINSGEDFVKIAKEYSTCPSKKRGGDLGWFTKGQMVPEFEKAAFNLSVGAMTIEPIKTKFGYHIIKRTG